MLWKTGAGVLCLLVLLTNLLQRHLSNCLLLLCMFSCGIFGYVGSGFLKSLACCIKTLQQTATGLLYFPSEASLHSETHEGPEHEEYSSIGKKTRTTWEVDVMNEEGIVKKKRLKTVELWSLPSALRVMVPFDKFHAPICDAAALYTGVLAVLAQEMSSFPINYINWRHIPDEYKEDMFNKTIMPKFHFEDVEIAKHWTF